MKYLFFSVVCLIATALILSCKKEDAYKSNGVIYGSDPRMCVCCGGWLIKIDSSNYQFSDIPENSNFKLDYTASLPIYVKLDWQIINSSCTPLSSDMKWIKVLRIKKE